MSYSGSTVLTSHDVLASKCGLTTPVTEGTRVDTALPMAAASALALGVLVRSRALRRIGVAALAVAMVRRNDMPQWRARWQLRHAMGMQVSPEREYLKSELGLDVGENEIADAGTVTSPPRTTAAA